ncbi:MAG: hypothetical protein HOV80_32915 [Polyangiaceae bacterium]|nr:hypothetical protein [Polyangiaceae bacterium]
MGASGALDVLAAFLRWFFLGSIKNDLYGVGLGAAHPGLAAKQALGHFLLMRVGFSFLVAFIVGWGFSQPIVAAAVIGTFFALAAAWFVSRAKARVRVLVAATRALDEGAPLDPAAVTTPAILPGRSLGLLAVATDAARRGDAVLAGTALDGIDLAFLHADERRLLAGVRAIVADRTGDRATAARFGLMAFPVGAPDIDERLGRIFAERNWHDATKLSRAYEDWLSHGFLPEVESPIGRLLLLIDVKLGRLDPASVAQDVRLLEAEARSLGDRELADKIRDEALPFPGSRYG